MDWSDHYVENFLSASDSEEAKNALQKICLLWIEYANFDTENSKTIYEKAMTDDLVKECPEIIISFSSYHSKLGKFEESKRIIVERLSSNLPSKTVDMLWIELQRVISIKETHPKSIKHLYDEIKSLGSKSISSPSANLLNSQSYHQEAKILNFEEYPEEPKLEISNKSVESEQKVSQQQIKQVASPLGRIVFDRIFDNTSSFTAEQLHKLYSTRPPMLFYFTDKVMLM
jgi:hypothetical protein